MGLSPYAADSLEAVDHIRAAVDRVVRVDAAFPGWPFRVGSADSVLWEFDVTLWPEFGRVLGSLADDFGDEEVLLYVPDPSPTIASFAADGTFWAFRIPAAALPDAYAQLMYPPTERNQVGIEANRVAICGSSGEWGVWAQRDWELGILASTGPVDLSGSGLAHVLPTSGPRDLHGNDGLAARLADAQRALLMEAVATHAVGQ